MRPASPMGEPGLEQALALREGSACIFKTLMGPLKKTDSVPAH